MIEKVPVFQTFEILQVLLKVLKTKKHHHISSQARKKLKIDVSMKREDFHCKTGIQFLECLVKEIELAFDKTDLLVVKALYVLDHCSVPQSDAADFLQHRNNKMKILLKFYGKMEQVS